MVAEAQRGKKHIRKHQREKRATEHNTHIQMQKIQKVS